MGGTCYYCKSGGIVSMRRIRNARTADLKRVMKYLQPILKKRRKYDIIRGKYITFTCGKFYDRKRSDFDVLEIDRIKHEPWRIAHNFDKTKNLRHHSTKMRLKYHKARLQSPKRMLDRMAP